MRRTARQPRDSQVERILAYALAGNPIHADDWYEGGPDGGSRCRSVRSRISDIQALGYGFDHRREPNGTVSYWLRHVPDEPRQSAPTQAREDSRGDAGAAEQLALELPRPLPGLYDVDEAA